MKNLKLSAKVGILVAILLATTLTVAVVGVRQLAALDAAVEEMVDVTGRAMILAGDARVSLLQAVRSEKNAILAPEKERAVEFADGARQSLAHLKDRRSELMKVIGLNVATPEGKALSDLSTAIDAFEKNQKEVLRLAVLKTNTEAEIILHKDMHPRAGEVEQFVLSLAEPVGDDTTATTQPGGSSRQSAKVVMGQQVLGRLFDVMYHLSAHIAAPTEQVMLRIDEELRVRMLPYQESVRRFSATLSDAERSRGLSVLSFLDGVRVQAARIQELSHVNSDVYAQALTSTNTVEVADQCNTVAGDLIKAITDRRDNNRRNVAESSTFARNAVISAGAAGALLSVILAFLTIRSITRPVSDGVRVFESIASGDLTKRMNLDRHDEIGQLGAASDKMATSLCGVVTQIRSVARQLGDSAGQLSGVSTDLLSQSQQMTTQAESVAAGTEQMSTNVSTMAAAAEEMSVNVSGISSASEEVSVNVASIVENASSTSRSVGSVAESIARITASLQDVAKDARHGSQMTKQARDMATAATTAMRQLDQAASEITKVTEVIKSIALQTNLLALNATIEATSAGEAGKGFAVVASEVKELASQSAHSAEEIARKIESVQTSTRDAVKVIESVAQAVDQVNVSAGRISESVDGQTQTASQIVAAVAEARQGVESIARSIAEVAKGATDVSRNTAEAATAATDVSRNASEAAKASETISSNIHGVSDATRHNSASAVKVNEAAVKLKEIADQLQRSVSRFNVGDENPASSHD